jgi:hypothetical protein
MPLPIKSRVERSVKYHESNGEQQEDTCHATRERNTALPELAREPDLIKAISRDIANMGLVGERDAGLLVYLAYSSRKLANPLSVIIKGPSSSGKDEIQRRPADLMPDKDVIDAMSITPQALYYGEAGWLKHKIILVRLCELSDRAYNEV